MGAWYDFLLTTPSFVMTPQEVAQSSRINDSPGDAAIRAVGINPATMQPSAPQYAGTIALEMMKRGIDPNSPNAMNQLTTVLRNEESVFRQRAYDQSQQQQEKAAFPWGKALAWGGVGLLATIVLVKVM